MKRNLEFTFFILSTLAIASGCISLKINKKEKIRSTSYQYQDPAEVFQILPTDFADHAWQSRRTANSIVVLTECSSLADQELKTISKEHFAALQKVELEKETYQSFADRKAFLAVAKGEVDGVPVKMALHTTNKNGCNYTITYLGRVNSFSEEYPLWETFLSGFKIK